MSDAKTTLVEAILAYVRAKGDEAHIVTHWVLVAEIVSNDEPDPWLKLASSESNAWTRVGMLTAGLQACEDYLRQGWASDGGDAR